jgi:hypothetical protein
MKKPRMNGHWKVSHKKLKQKWSQLTADDLRASPAEFNVLIDHIEKRTGETQEEVEFALCTCCDFTASGAGLWGNFMA